MDDPFLDGFFDKPAVKRHLKDVGVLKRKRRKSYSVTKRPKTTDKYGEYEKSPIRLPALEDAITSQ